MDFLILLAVVIAWGIGAGLLVDQKGICNEWNHALGWCMAGVTAIFLFWILLNYGPINFIIWAIICCAAMAFGMERAKNV